MSTPHLVIAILGAAAFGAGISAVITRPVINRLRAELSDAARKLTRDPLTGLHNRTGLHTARTAVTATGEPVITMLIDVDNFKKLNDTHGHDAGDALLVEVANRLQHLTAVHDGIAARLSGDEFAALVPLRRHRVTALAEQINQVIAEPVTLHTDDNTITVDITASIGVAVSTADLLAGTDLHRADIAMYHAKQQGGDRHVVHTDGMTMPERAPRRGPRRRDLRHEHDGSAE